MASHPEPSSSAADHNFIKIPRWVIYLQVGLLCVVPTTCFLLGLAAAQLSRPASSTSRAGQPSQLSGRLISADESPLSAVVIALPLDRDPGERVDPHPLHPTTFQELGNPAILAIQQHGGAVTRTGEAGTFRLEVANQGRFLLVAIATNPADSAGKGEATLDRAATAELSLWFLPLDNLYRGHAVKTVSIHPQGRTLELGSLSFSD